MTDNKNDLLDDLGWWYGEMDQVTVSMPVQGIHRYNDNVEAWDVGIHLEGSDAGQMTHIFNIFIYPNQGFNVEHLLSHISFVVPHMDGYKIQYESNVYFYYGLDNFEKLKQLLIKIEDKFGMNILDKINL